MIYIKREGIYIYIIESLLCQQKLTQHWKINLNKNKIQVNMGGGPLAVSVETTGVGEGGLDFDPSQQ